MTIFILATLDTKGEEARFVRERLAALDLKTCLVDTGCLGTPSIQADVSRDDLFRRAGTTLAEVRARGDRGTAVQVAAAGARELVLDARRSGTLSGVLAIGGSAGTTIGTEAMRALELGVPKVMVSTLASGQVRHFVGDKDILMLNSVVDLAGLNRISRTILAQAAHAMAGMALFGSTAPPDAGRPLIAATMFGVTTPCVAHARLVLEAAGYEVLVFHATGNGGQAMESLIRDGLIAGVLDITTTELADELVGGVLSAGPTRLTAAAERGVPQVVSVGALDMVNFHAFETVPAQFRERKLHRHNANVTLMRTTADENRALGAEIGRKVAASRGPAVILLPRRGISAIDAEGQPFEDAAARRVLFAAIRESCAAIPCLERDEHLNDASFADAAANALLALLAPLPPLPPLPKRTSS